MWLAVVRFNQCRNVYERGLARLGGGRWLAVWQQRGNGGLLGLAAVGDSLGLPGKRF